MPVRTLLALFAGVCLLAGCPEQGDDDDDTTTAGDDDVADDDTTAGDDDSGDDDSGNTPPQVSVPADLVSMVGRTVTLPGEATDADGDTLTLTWTQGAGPAATLDDPTIEAPSFRAMGVGEYEFTLVASDGEADSAPATIAVQVHDLDGGEDFTVGLKPDGSLWTWGANEAGQLGDGTFDDRGVPGRVCAPGATDCDAEPFEGAIAVSTGRAHAIVLKDDGTVWAFGNNWDGQVGDGTWDHKTTPVPVCAVGAQDCTADPLTDVVAIAAGYVFSAALKDDGTLLAWGGGYDGQLGNATQMASNTPVQVCAEGETDPCSAFLGSVEVFAAGGGGHTLALQTDGTLWGWGHNKAGQVGNGDSDVNHVLTPTRVCDQGGSYPCTAFLPDVVDVDAWSAHSLALQADGTLWGWGGNDQYELGAVTTDICYNGTVCTETPVPVCLSGDDPCTQPFGDVEAFAAARRFSTALRTDGSVWAWGDNTESQLGTGDTVMGQVPAPVCAVGQTAPCSAFLEGVAGIATGSFHVLALTDDGTLLAWGDDDHGQLGDNGKADQGIPIVVSGY